MMLRWWNWIALAALGVCTAGCPMDPLPFYDASSTDATTDGRAADSARTDVPTGGDAFDAPEPSDVGPRCSSAQMVCDGLCVNVMTDENNCGSCGHACGEDQACYSGSCHLACPTGLTACADPMGGTDVCVDLQNSRFNCGTCGHSCPPTGTCSSGVCILDCGTRTLCHAGDGGVRDGGSTGGDGGGVSGDSYCADLTFDNGNCGMCGNACPTNYTCTSGRCVISCVFPEMGCPPAAGMTMSFCANLSTDANNCGTCGHACPAGQSCVGGTCTCPAPRLACGTLCVDPNTDAMHCGTCTRACAAGQYCMAGACASCPAPNTICPGGVCTNLSTDPSNCGACANSCGIGGACTAGRCTCATGYMMCGTACADVRNDPRNCGTCGHVCPAGQYCIASACTATPPTRYMVASPAPTFPFINACAAAGHTTVLAGSDDGSSPATLPFAMRYWATNLPAGQAITVSSNGWVIMNSGTAFASLSGSIPPGGYTALVGPHWSDNYQRTGICIATIGSAPNRQFVIEWNDCGYCCPASAGTDLTFEVIFNEGSNIIDFAYQTMTGARAAGMGMTDATAGAMTISGCAGGAGSCVPTAGQRVRFVPIP